MLMHTIIAVALQIAFWFIFGNLLVGAVACSLMFLMREVTQNEYKWIKKYGNNKRANMPWYGGFVFSIWDFKSLTDWIVPSAIVWLIFILI